MSKVKPTIITPFDDKKRFKNLVLEVITDTFIYTHTPDSVTIINGFLVLTLTDKKFVFQEIEVDTLSEYMDVYLQGLKLEDDIYIVVDNGSNLTISFTKSIGLDQNLYTSDDFEVKGKIVSR